MRERRASPWFELAHEAFVDAGHVVSVLCPPCPSIEELCPSIFTSGYQKSPLRNQWKTIHYRSKSYGHEFSSIEIYRLLNRRSQVRALVRVPTYS